MARGKKKESALTPEEKLAQALIPEGEQPYRVPENWCWTTLKNVSNIVMGQSPAGTDTTDDPSYIPLIGGAADMGALYPKATRYTKVPTKISHAEDIILCIRATLGRPIYSDGEYCLGRGVAAIRSTILSKEFLRFFFIDQEQYLYDNATGTTFAQINSDTLSQMPIALPPLAEQQRIVNRIEYLFAKLDEAKEKAQSVLDSFETRKAAILHKAFNGELTAKWREECNKTSHQSVDITLNDLCTKITDGFHNSPVPTESGYPYVMAGNVHETGIDYYNGLYMDEKNHRELYNKAHPEKGDILIVNIGASTGRSAMIDVDFEFSFKNCAILKLKKEQVNSKYILYYIWLRKDYLLKEVTRGGAQPFLSLKMLKGISVPMVDLSEQQEIVHILDSLFAKEQQAKEAAEAVLEKIDLLKKSILARAFRGELGTNDPSEESAVELLKSLFQA